MRNVLCRDRVAAPEGADLAEDHEEVASEEAVASEEVASEVPDSEDQEALADRIFIPIGAGASDLVFTVGAVALAVFWVC